MQQVQALQHERAAVAARQLGQRRAQGGTGNADQAQCDRAGAQAIPGAQVQERAADETIAGAEQLQYADFLAAGLDVQAHGVADHQRSTDAEQHRQHLHQPRAEREPCIQALAPQRVMLDQVRPGQAFQRACQPRIVLALAGGDHQQRGQRVVIECVDGFAEAGLAQFLQALLRRAHGDAGNIRAIA
ncbi:hypothetical protein D3C73_859870 [compost metagenome]